MNMIWQKLMDGAVSGAGPTPVVEQIATQSTTSAATSHNVTMPSTVNAGDLLMVLLCGFSTTETWSPPAGDGWQTLNSEALAGVFYKIADGTEDGGTKTFTSSGSIRCQAQVWRISGQNSSAPVEAAFATRTTGSANPPNLTPSWGAANTLWIAGCGSRDSNYTVTTWPTNYSSNQTSASPGTGQNGRMDAASRALNASSDDPGAFSFSTAVRDNVSFTLAVRPA